MKAFHVFTFMVTQLLVLSVSHSATPLRNVLAKKLYLGLAKDNSQNIFLSPFSIDLALTALAMGTAGTSLQELQTALAIPGDENALKEYSSKFAEVLKDDKNLTVANSIFLDNQFNVKESYQNDLVKYFKSSVNKVDFYNRTEESRVSINQWVEDHTNKKIKELFPPGSVNPTTVAVLLNAVHFKSEWIHPFDKKQTSTQTFYGLGSDYETDMMVVRRKFNYKYVTSLESHLVLLPYTGNYRMLLVVPQERKGIIEVESRLEALLENAPSFLDQFVTDVERTYIKLLLPKFNLEVRTDLKSLLKKIGVNSIFSESADLSKISDEEIVVSDVVHKAVINIDETSTEAAASTGVKIELRSFPFKPKPVIVKADHPFIFAILHKTTKSIIFVGRLSKLEK